MSYALIELEVIRRAEQSGKLQELRDEMSNIDKQNMIKLTTQTLIGLIEMCAAFDFDLVTELKKEIERTK